MPATLFSAVRDLSRLREISSVLIRHGLGDVVRRAGVAPLLARAGQILHWGESPDVAHLEPQQRMRLAFEELGPTFVKLGQMLSTREDLLPPAWTAEFERLHSDVAPVPFDELLPQIERALGRSPFDVFGDLDREPYAAASIAQVHRATLAHGAPVILKIRRPGIAAKIDADARTCLRTRYASLAKALQKNPTAFVYQPRTHSVTSRVVSRKRLAELAATLEASNCFIVEDDGVGDVSPLPPISLGELFPERVAHMSFSRSLGPDLRLAVLSSSMSVAKQIQSYRSFSSG